MTKLIKWSLSGWLFALLDWDWSEIYAKDKKHITGNQSHYELCSKKCVDYPNTDCKCSHADFNK